MFVSVMNYEGKLRLSDKNKMHLATENANLQIFGEFGSTGRFPVKLVSPDDDKTVSVDN